MKTFQLSGVIFLAIHIEEVADHNSPFGFKIDVPLYFVDFIDKDGYMNAYVVDAVNLDKEDVL